MKTLLILLTLINLRSNSFAGGQDVGNGGDVIIKDNQALLLDLVESGSEEVTLNSDCKISDDLPKLKINKLLDQLENTIDEKSLKCKILELRKIDRHSADAISVAINSYEWVLVNLPFSDIDDDYTVLDKSRLNMPQAAVRRNNVIRIDRNIWSLMNETHKTALIIHEAVYSLIEPIYKPKRTLVETTNYLAYIIQDFEAYQSSPIARDITGYIFSNKLNKFGKDGLRKMIGAHWGESFQITSKETFTYLQGVLNGKRYTVTPNYLRYDAQQLCKKFESRSFIAQVAEYSREVISGEISYYSNSKTVISRGKRDIYAEEKYSDYKSSKTSLLIENDKKSHHILKKISIDAQISHSKCAKILGNIFKDYYKNHF